MAILAPIFLTVPRASGGDPIDIDAVYNAVFCSPRKRG